MKLAYVLLAIVIMVALFGYTKYNTTPVSLTNSIYSDKLTYTCSKGATLDVYFSNKFAKMSLSDGRTFNLERRSVSDESGVKYSNEADKITLWTRDDSAFVEESGVTTFQACRISKSQ